MPFQHSSVPYAEGYLNAQLKALWGNPEEHAEPPQCLDTRYFTALIGRNQDEERMETPPTEARHLPFVFDAPSIHFICNHEVVLRLNVRVDVGTDDPQSGSWELQPRIPFRISGLGCGKAKVELIDDREFHLRFCVLDLSGFYLPSRVPLEGGDDHTQSQRQIVEDSLPEYFELWHKAGYDILHYLPDFNNSNFRHTTSFISAVSDVSVDVPVVKEVWSIPTEKINEFLYNAWLNAMILAHISTDTLSTGPSLSLAQFDSAWGSHNYTNSFYIKFSPPTVEAVCRKEVLISFNIRNILFYEDTLSDAISDNPTEELGGGKFSFLSIVERERIRDNIGTILSLDIGESNYELMDGKSHLPTRSAGPEDSRVHKSQELVKQFFTTEYLPLLQREALHFIYNSDAILHDADPDSKPDGAAESPATQPSDISDMYTTSNVQGFDVLNGISQAEINEQLQTSHGRQESWCDILRRWSYVGIVDAEFGPMTIRFLDGDHVIVTIHVKSGIIQVAETAAERPGYEIHGWKLALKVRLSKCLHGKTPGVDKSWFTKAMHWFWKKLGGKSRDCELCHIYVDFTDAELVPDSCQFGNLFPRPSADNAVDDVALNESMGRLETLWKAIREQYLPSLMKAGHHILRTIPIWKPGKRPGALTGIQVGTTSAASSPQKNISSILIIAGVTGDKPPPPLPPNDRLQWLANIGIATNSGIFCMSRDDFLLPKVIPLFSAVNAQTTMSSSFAAAKEGDADWQIQLVPWARDALRMNRPTDFTQSPIERENKHLSYTWQHEELWTYKERWSNMCLHEYEVRCRTENHLVIPINYVRDLKIRIEGRTELFIKRWGSAKEDWNANAAVNWQSTLMMATAPSGEGNLRVTSTREVPTYEGDDSTQERIPKKILKDYFSTAPALDDVVNLFRKFEDPSDFTYSSGGGTFNPVNPSFNRHGDLLFGLRPTVEPPTSIERDLHPPAVLSVNSGSVTPQVPLHGLSAQLADNVVPGEE